MRKILLTVLFTCLATAGYSEENSGDNARRLCAVIDATKLSSAPCDYSVWGHTITATFDMSATEARKLCEGISSLARQKGITFSRGWKLQINSPYSSSSIAFCDL